MSSLRERLAALTPEQRADLTRRLEGRRAEGLGALGRREGIACWAVAVLIGVEPGTTPGTD